MCRRTCYLICLILLPGLTGSVLADICRWTDRGQDHRWDNPDNWHYGLIPTSEDRFVSTPYYAQRPDWSKYRILIEDDIEAVCKNAKNMNQLIMDITGGSLTVLNEWKIGQDDGIGVVINMSGGEVNVGTYVDLCGWSQNYSMGTLNMSGGAFSVRDDLRMGMWSTSHSYLNLYGGTVRAATLAVGAGEARIDITEGMLIVAGDQAARVEYYVTHGVITGYGGVGMVLYDYDITVPNMTAVTAIPEPATLLLVGLGGLTLLRRRWR